MDNCGILYANLSKQNSEGSKNDFIYMPFWESKTTGAGNRSAVVLRQVGNYLWAVNYHNG